MVPLVPNNADAWTCNILGSRHKIAARVDGAGMLRSYRSVVLPVSGPAFAVVLIWQFTSMWNDFLFAVFLGAPNSWPVTVWLNNTAGSGAAAVSYSQQVTPPLPEGSGFSGRFRGLMGKPCPEDVGCRVHVSVCGVPARPAREVGLGEAVVLRTVPAAGARAGGVGGVHRDQLTTGAFSLVRKDPQEHPPTRIQDRTVQPGLLGDVAARPLEGAGR